MTTAYITARTPAGVALEVESHRDAGCCRFVLHRLDDGGMLDLERLGAARYAAGLQAVVELAQRCPVRLAWSRTMFDGRFKDRQPESLTAEEWKEVRTNLMA